MKIAFYSLMGVSSIFVNYSVDSRGKLSTPLWEFRESARKIWGSATSPFYSLMGVSCKEYNPLCLILGLDKLSTPLWEFPVSFLNFLESNSNTFCFLLPYGSFLSYPKL